MVAVSPEDAALIRDRFKQPNVDVVENGIDRDFFASASGTRDPRRILFLGAPGLAAQPGCRGPSSRQGFSPKVLAQAAEARLFSVGRNPPASLVQRVVTMPQVELHANVPDVRPFLAESGVMTVPLRIGGGSRLKILEALACGLPVVSTHVGAEGLCLQPGEHYTLTEDDGMAAALVQTLRQPEKVQELARNRRDLVLEMYDWEVLADKLDRIWEGMGAACLSHT